MSQMLSTQTAFSDAIVKLSSRFRSTVVCAVRDTGLKLQRFEQQFPERFYDFGFSDAACVGASAGMTVRGRVPFVCANALALTGRCYEMVRNSVCYPNLNVKFIGTYAGFSLAQDGGSMQACEDLALMRVLPQMKVFSPADYWEALRIFEFLASDYGPAYVRLSSISVPEIYDQSFVFQEQKAKILREGSTVALFATGTMVSIALGTADFLEKKGISTTVVDVATLKPLDVGLVQEIAQKVKILVTVEEHSVIGGLGAALLDVFDGKLPCHFQRIGLQDCFGESGTLADLYKVSGLHAESIGAQIQKLL